MFTPQVLNEMTDLLSSCRNYDNYRQAYNRCTGFKIPILGVHLKDLISVNEAMSDYVEDNKVNVQKLQALYSHINDLIQLQQIPPKLDANKDLVHLLTVANLSAELCTSILFQLLCRFVWFTNLCWTHTQMQMSVLQHVDCLRSCGCDESLWSMSVWVTGWMWMRVSSDCCIVVLSVCGVLIVLEWQNAREEIIVSLQPKSAIIKTCFKEKSAESLFSFCLPPMCWYVFSVLLQLSLDLYYSEDEIYELSYAREPKNCKAPVSDRSRDT